VLNGVQAIESPLRRWSRLVVSEEPSLISSSYFPNPSIEAHLFSSVISGSNYIRSYYRWNGGEIIPGRAEQGAPLSYVRFWGVTLSPLFPTPLPAISAENSSINMYDIISMAD